MCRELLEPVVSPQVVRGVADCHPMDALRKSASQLGLLPVNERVAWRLAALTDWWC